MCIAGTHWDCEPLDQCAPTQHLVSIYERENQGKYHHTDVQGHGQKRKTRHAVFTCKQGLIHRCTWCFLTFSDSIFSTLFYIIWFLNIMCLTKSLLSLSTSAIPWVQLKLNLNSGCKVGRSFTDVPNGSARSLTCTSQHILCSTSGRRQHERRGSRDTPSKPRRPGEKHRYDLANKRHP